MHLATDRITSTTRARRSAISLLALFCGTTATSAQEATPVPDVTVAAPAPRSPSGVNAPRAATGSAPRAATPAQAAPEGSEAAGYKPKTVENFGPFGGMSILDAPYSVNVTSSDLLENRMAFTQDDIYKINPLIQQYTTAGRAVGAGNFTARGFQGINVAEDGMRIWTLLWPALEDKERVEYISGLTSFLYGAYDVGGILNYVYKRPTAAPIVNITVGDYGRGAGFIHGDFGGPIDKEGQFGYRLNIVGQTGQLPIEYEENQRNLLSGMLSWRPSKDTVLELSGSHQYVRYAALDPAWSFATNANGASSARHPSAPDLSSYYGQPWSHSDTETDRVAVNFSSKLNETFTVRAAFEHRDDDQLYASATNNTVSANTGAYTQSSFSNPRTDYLTNSGYAYLDTEYDSWLIHQKLTVGYNGNITITRAANVAAVFSPTINQNFNIGPIYTFQPANFYSIEGPTYVQRSIELNNYVIGDEIHFGPMLTALVGANAAGIKQNVYDQTVNGPHWLTQAYDKNQVTPTLSLIGKPLPWFSVYGTYSQSLQQGVVAPTTGSVIYTNAGQVFAPILGTEWDVGAKAEVHGLLLTAALFRIEQALQVNQTNPNGTHTLTQSGLQANKGLELTATGNLSEGLRIYGGVTLIDPRIEQNQANPASDGRRAQNVADRLIKLTAEYDIPFLPGLTLTGGVYHTGSQAVDILNTEFLRPFTTADIGLRFRGKLPTGQEAVFRLNVSNLSDQRYWVSSLYLGAPRAVAMSAQIKF